MMLNRKSLSLLTVGAVAIVALAACNNGGKSATSTEPAKSQESTDKFSVVMISDGGGVDDKSFNQSAWEGLQKWGKETDKKKGTDGFNYIQPSGEKEYATAISGAVKAKYDLIFGTGFQLQKAFNTAAEENKDSKFVTIDSVIDEKYTNGASLLFAEHEAAFLAGVAAAKTTKTNHVGYIGGISNETLIRFEAGFTAGVKSVNKDIQVDRQYVGSFGDSAKGKILANTMYTSGADVIYAAAGASGLGAFSAATELMTSDSSKTVWVIGVDKDQAEDGKYTVDGKEKTVTLTSTLKKVGDVMYQFIKETQANGFKPGVTRYTLKDGGVDLTDGELTEEIRAEVKKIKEDIIGGKIEVPSTIEELEAYLQK